MPNGNVESVSGIIPCEGCGAEIFFVPTTRGKMAPVEKDPVFLVEENGGPIAGFAKTEGGPWPYVRGRSVEGIDREILERSEEPPVLKVHISHHATCPQAPRFRR